MAIVYRLIKNNIKGKMFGKYYAKSISLGEVHTSDLAKKISSSNSVTESDVYAVVAALMEEMKLSLGEGHTVVLDGFGRFKLSIESDLVDNPETFDAGKNIRGVRCKFIAEGKRISTGRNLLKAFSKGVKCVRLPKDLEK